MEAAIAAAANLATKTSRSLSDLWAAHVRGRLTRTQFIDRASAVVAAANAQGVALADLAVTAELARFLREAVPPLGLTPTDVQTDRRRIAAALERVITTEHGDTPEQVAESKAARVARFGRDEPLLTVATTTQVALSERGARGWTRVLDNQPCPVCIRLADGKVRSNDTIMRRHKGCGCMQQPVWRPRGNTRPSTDPGRAVANLQADLAALAR